MSRSRRLLSTAAALLLCAGCGGGFYLSYNLDDDDDPDGGPAVSLSVDASRAAPGDVVRLTASAGDRDGIDNVAFYGSSELGGWQLLARDLSFPYVFDTVVPGNASSVSYYARATDRFGNGSTSNTVSVQIMR